jgi:hypothetical protein
MGDGERSRALLAWNSSVIRLFLMRRVAERRWPKGITMANKTNFTAEEWGRVLSSPMVAGIAITAADPSGVWGILKEGMAGARALLDARQNAQAIPLVKAIAEDFATTEGRSAAQSALQSRMMGKSASGLKDAALAELRAVSEMVDAKAPDDAAGFKAWLQDVAQKAAEAGTEGGFLGFGGVAVSDAEKSTIAEISSALTRRAA